MDRGPRRRPLPASSGRVRVQTQANCGVWPTAVGTGTHNHRPTGYAGAVPTRGPHSTSKGKHTERKQVTQTDTYRQKERRVARHPLPFPAPGGGYAGGDRRREWARDTSTTHTTPGTKNRACKCGGFVSTRASGRTRLQPDTARLPSLLHIRVRYGVSIQGTSFLPFFASEVHFDPWGLQARHAATLPSGRPTGL